LDASLDQIARREAWEEIGLPMDDSKLPPPFRIEPLCSLPCSLAKTELVARPCVAFLHADEKLGDKKNKIITADEAMIPRLDAKEVAAVFTAPFANFLRNTDEEPQPGDPPLPPGHWYDGRWINWQTDPWRVHNFHVPVHNQRVMKPKKRTYSNQPPADDLLEKEPATNGENRENENKEKEEGPAKRFLVWGMTGRILVDAARIAYGREPEFEHNTHFGDEKLIAELEDGGKGRLAREKEKRGDDVGVDATKEEVKDAKM
jgi:peroxisomal coenzyme A diphosphatase NUDT7